MHVNFWASSANQVMLRGSKIERYPGYIDQRVGDAYYACCYQAFSNVATGTGEDRDVAHYTACPVNMTVLYCIKASRV